MSNPFGNDEAKQDRVPIQKNDEENQVRQAILAGSSSSSSSSSTTASKRTINNENLPVAIDPHDENAVIRFLVSDRVYGYPYTSGTILSNYFRFVITKHPLFSIFLHYRLDPYNTKKRFLVFVCILCFAVALSYVLLGSSFAYQIAICRDGCSTSNSDLCIGTQSTGSNSTSSTYVATTWGGCQYYRSWMLPAIIGGVLVIYGSLLRFFASCGCLQGRNFFQFNCLGSRIRALIEFCGGGFLSVFLLMSLGMIMWVLIATYMSNKSFDIFIAILISKAWSFGEWFIWTFPYFSLRYSWDKRHFQNRMREISNGSRSIYNRN